jgi:HSP20 family molecular chaperone IbpA
MNNKNFSNTISLFQAFDDICDKALTSYTNNSTGTSNIKTYVGDVIDIYKDWHYDFGWIWTQPNYVFDYKIETLTYPVSNSSILDDGTSVLEIAVSGFSSDEITVKREDLKIIVEGKKQKEEETKKKKYLYKQIAERDFTMEFIGSDKWDFNNLKVLLKNGILRIEVPILESCKPVNKIYKITE